MSGHGRAQVHWGDSGSWTYQGRTLNFLMGSGVTPPEVYLPPATMWPSVAPAWAHGLRDQVIADFEAIGLRVVSTERASTW